MFLQKTENNYNSMCIVVFKTFSDPTSKYKLVVAANRDEYYARPSKAASFVDENLICGLDMQPGVEGGTWLGANTNGKVAFLTNILVKKTDPDKSARGRIVRDYLESDCDQTEYIENYLAGKNHRMFNFVGMSLDDSGRFLASYYGKSEKDEGVILRGDCAHVVACTSLENKWKKKQRVHELFEKSLAVEKNPSETCHVLFNEVLSDSTSFHPDQSILSQAPSGFSEHFLYHYSSVCINNVESYGTRTQTVILVDQNDKVYFSERNRDNHLGEWKTVVLEYELKNQKLKKTIN